MNKEDLIMLQVETAEEQQERELDEIVEENQLDELVECKIEDMKIQKFEENVVLLQNLLKVFTDEQIEILSCLVDNELESNTSYLDDIKGKEKECWEEHNIKLKEISAILKH